MFCQVIRFIEKMEFQVSIFSFLFVKLAFLACPSPMLMCPIYLLSNHLTLTALGLFEFQVSVVFIPNFVKLAFLCLSLPHVDVSNLFYIKSPRLDRLRVI